MHDAQSLLNQLAMQAVDAPAPRTAAEAEAILSQLAGPSLKPAGAAAARLDRAAAKKPSAGPKPTIDEILQSVEAVRKYVSAYEAVPNGLLVVDRRGSIALVNSQLEKLFGYSRHELLGQPVEILVPERFRESHPAKREAYMEQPRVRPMGIGLPLTGRHSDGRYLPVEISLSPLMTEAGMMVVATVHDMTEQRGIEAQIRRFEARYRTLVEGLPAVTFMAVLDEGLNELYVSPQIETLLGFSQEEWLGNPILWFTQLHPDDRLRWHAEFAQTCSDGRPFNSIYRFYSRSGRVVWVHGEAKVVRDENGRPLFLQGVAFDITQLKEAEEQLRQLNLNLESRVEQRTGELSAANESLQAEIRERLRAEAEVRRINADLARAHEEAIGASQIKSQFLANMSHELRTPLNAIIGYSELLQVLAARKNDDSYVSDLQRINNAGRHLLTLINDILDISKIEAGKMQLELAVIPVPPVVKDVQDTAAPLAASNANVFEVRLGDALGRVKADAVRLKQCLLNLLSNACKFTREGRVSLTVTQEQIEGREWIAFRVEDTGIGMTDEQAARLFQPFSQADATTTRKFGGTGLGLAITKKLCEAMGGAISLESRLGQGSAFTLRLPVWQVGEFGSSESRQVG